MVNPLCDSLVAQWTNPIRTWSRDNIVCISGNTIIRQAQHKSEILGNTNGNGTGNVTSGYLSKKLQYAKFATTPPRKGQAYASGGNPNIQNLPVVNNKIILNCPSNS